MKPFYNKITPSSQQQLIKPVMMSHTFQTFSQTSVSWQDMKFCIDLKWKHLDLSLITAVCWAISLSNYRLCVIRWNIMWKRRLVSLRTGNMYRRKYLYSAQGVQSNFYLLLESFGPNLQRTKAYLFVNK